MLANAARQSGAGFPVRVVALDDTETGLSRAEMQAFELALGRPPADTERSASTAFIESQIVRRHERDAKRETSDVRRQAIADFCQTLFSLNEFLYVD